MLIDYQADKASFDLWLARGAADNQPDIDKVKRMIPVALKECCTEKQRLYITHFFVDRMMMVEIAALYGVNKATVSRCIRLGLRRMHDHLKFCSPELCADMPKQGPLTLNRKGHKTSE